MKRLPLLALALLAIVCSTSAYCDVPPTNRFLLWYLGNTLLANPNSAGPGISFTKQYPMAGGMLDGVIVDDPEATDGKALFISDNSTSDMVWYRSQPGCLFDNSSGATIVGRVKVTSDIHGEDGSAGANLSILDATEGSGLRSGYHWGGANGHVIETIRGESAEFPTGDGQYHILRMTAQGNVYGKQCPWDENFEDYEVGQPLVGQDEWIGNAGGGYDPQNPTQLVSGLTVVDDPDEATRPTHGKVTAFVGGDAIYQGYVRVLAAPDPNTNEMVVECDIKGTGDVKTCWFLDVNDLNGVNICQWYGASSTCRPRIAGTVNVGTTRPLTCNGQWDHLKIVINTQTKRAKFYLNGEVDPNYPDGLDYTNRPGVGPCVEKIGQIAFRSPWDYQGRNVLYFDNLSVNGVPVTEGFRTIKLYVDENPEPVLAISPASPAWTGWANNFFGFGSTSIAGQQDVYFDWVTATNRGAFAPGEEVAVLGHSLVPGAPVSTIDDAKTCPDGTPVVIPEAVVTASFVNNLTEMSPIGFAIEKPDRTAGIRVVQSGGYATSPGEKVSITGFTATVNGERVILASEITSLGTGFDTPAPLAMNQKASGGGVFGGQPNVWDVHQAMETFSYPDGALIGQNLWYGNAPASRIGVTGGVLRVQGGAGAFTAAHSAGTALGAESFEMSVKMKRGVGTANIWQLFAYDSQGVELVRWYGSGTSARPRIGGSILPSIVLTDDNWHTLKINYTFATNTAEFFFDGVSKGTITGLTGNDILGRVEFMVYDQPALTDNYALFDDLQVDGFTVSTPAVGLSNVGLLVRVFGKITEMNITGDLDGWFRIEDGSRVNQPAASGIRCRVPEWDTLMMFVQVGDYIQATGVLGVDNGLRYLWTTDYCKY